jgi:hypothetical protein
VFDGQGVRYDRSSYTCAGQNEGGQSSY